MKVLLDTHMLLWYHAADKDLPKYANSIIRSEQNRCYVSIISLWEISVKHSIGKLPLRVSLREFIALVHAAGFRSLDLLSEHVITAATLPLHHRDPFDRMLIAQARSEGMHILTADPHFAAYEVPLAG